MSIEVMRQALDALEQIKCFMFHPAKVFTWEPSIIALRTAIEQAAEPVAWEAVYETIIHWDEGGGKRSRRELARRIVALYTNQPAAPRQWVGLTEEEIAGEVYKFEAAGAWYQFARAIEAKLKEKNDVLRSV